MAALLAAGVCRADRTAPSVHTLEECVRFGLEHSTTARRARLGEDIARTEIGQARSTALPHVSLDASYTRPDEVRRADSGETSWMSGSDQTYGVGAGVTQLLYNGGQARAALRAADLALDYADAERRAVEAGLVRDIEVQFYGLLLAEDAVAVQGASVEQLHAVAEQVGDRHESGADSEFDLLTAQVRLANERPKLIEARNALELARAAFRTLLNHQGEVSVTGSLERATVMLGLEEAEERALRNRHELRRSGIRVGLGREAVIGSRSEGLPTIKAFFNYRGSNATAFGPDDDEWDWNWDTGLTLSWNLWDGDLTRQTVRRRQFELEQLRTLDETVREQVKLEVRQAYLELLHAREAIAASRGSVGLAERTLEIARTRHAAGLATYLEFSEANLALSTARLAWAKAQHDHAVAVSQLNFACGMRD